MWTKTFILGVINHLTALINTNIKNIWGFTMLMTVTPVKCQFLKDEIWINNISIDVWFGQYLKIWNLRVQKSLNIEKIIFKVVQIKFLAMQCIVVYFYKYTCCLWLRLCSRDTYENNRVTDLLKPRPTPQTRMQLIGWECRRVWSAGSMRVRVMSCSTSSMCWVWERARERCVSMWMRSERCLSASHPPALRLSALLQLLDAVTQHRAAPRRRHICVSHLQPAQITHRKHLQHTSTRPRYLTPPSIVSIRVLFKLFCFLY